MEEDPKKEEERKLIAVLQASEAEAFDKDVACRRLARIGSKEAVPALAALLADEHLCDVARHALEQIPDPAADTALRAALAKLKGRPLIAAIFSIGNRRDREAVGDLGKMLGGADLEAAAAAAAALGEIGGREVGATLSEALTNAPDGVRSAVGDACVTLADTLLERGRQDIAARMFDRVREARLPRHIRIAATRGAVLARQAEGATLLVELLKGEDYGMFEVALRAVRELPGTDVTRTVATQVASLPPDKRVLLLQALGDRRDPAALAVVLEAIKKGGETTVRVAAVQAAGQIGGEAAQSALKEAAADSDAEVAQAAQKSLAAFATGAAK